MFGMFGGLGLVITLVTVGGSLFFVFRVLSSLSRGEKERQRLLQSGVPAQARILGVQMGGMTVTTGVHRQLQLQLTVEVHPPGAALYNAQFTTLVSELQVPQVQPGAWIGVRIDPANPQSMAIEALGVAPPGYGAPPQAGYGAQAGMPGAPQPGYVGQAGMSAPAYGMPPGMGAGVAPTDGMPPFAYGTPPGMGAGVAPMGGFKLPMGAKIGIAVGLASAVIAVVVVVTMAWTSGAGGPSAVCTKAAACCKKATGSSCDHFTRQSGPVADVACEESLKAYRKSGICK